MQKQFCLHMLIETLKLRPCESQKNTMLLRRALVLHAETSIPEGECELQEIEVFERHLNMQVIISTAALNKIKKEWVYNFFLITNVFFKTELYIYKLVFFFSNYLQRTPA